MQPDSEPMQPPDEDYVVKPWEQVEAEDQETTRLLEETGIDPDFDEPEPYYSPDLLARFREKLETEVGHVVPESVVRSELTRRRIAQEQEWRRQDARRQAALAEARRQRLESIPDRRRRIAVARLGQLLARTMQRSA